MSYFSHIGLSKSVNVPFMTVVRWPGADRVGEVRAV